MFIYDGHGAPGDHPTLPGSINPTLPGSINPTLPGSIMLSGSTGSDDPEQEHFYRLSTLRDQLQDIATFTYQSVALMGSCYSGGIFQPSQARGENFTYALSPGAHAVTAAKADQLAWTRPSAGTVFFDSFINEVRTAKPPLNDIEVGFAVNEAGEPGHLGDDNIVSLGRAVSDVNEVLQRHKNPATKEPYPQLLIGQLAPDSHYEGAFFFLGSEQPEPLHSINLKT